MAQLAIKGHATRGNEVVEILEMLGGANLYNKSCSDSNLFCYLSNEKRICELTISESYRELTLFTLEEFLEKFPYKIGDKVLRKPYVGARQICEMRWDSDDNCIKYGIGVGEWFNVSQVQPYKEETMEGKNNDNWAKWDLPDGYEFQDKDGNIINTSVIRLVKKQSQYPKNYEECCKVLMGKTDFQDYSLLLTKLSTKINEADSISPEPPHITLINNFYKLLICRDAYWKIAVDWEPAWGKPDEMKYCIVNIEGNITNWVQKTTNKILSFPTAEMRDAFYENFKDLIESCKELL